MFLKQQATGWGQKKKKKGEERVCNYTSQVLGGVLESYDFLGTNCVTACAWVDV